MLHIGPTHVSNVGEQIIWHIALIHLTPQSKVSLAQQVSGRLWLTCARKDAFLIATDPRVSWKEKSNI